MIPIVTFLAPSFWMKLPLKVIHEPKFGLSGNYGLWQPKNHLMMDRKEHKVATPKLVSDYIHFGIFTDDKPPLIG